MQVNNVDWKFGITKDSEGNIEVGMDDKWAKNQDQTILRLPPTILPYLNLKIFLRRPTSDTYPECAKLKPRACAP